MHTERIAPHPSNRLSMGKIKKISRHIRLTVYAALLTSACGTATLAIPAANAAASTPTVTFCGKEITNVDPSNGISALKQFTEQGNNQIVGGIASAIGVAKISCPVISFLVETGADMVVGGSLLEVVDVRLPSGKDFLVAATHTAIEKAEQHTRPTLPDVGSSGTVLWAPVSWATLGINIRPEANTSLPSMGKVPDGVSLALQCSVYGQTITSAGGTTNVWDRVSYNGVTGYVADAYVNTGRLTPLAQSC